MDLTQLEREDKATRAAHRLAALLDHRVNPDWGALTAEEVTEFRQCGVALLELWDALHARTP